MLEVVVVKVLHILIDTASAFNIDLQILPGDFMNEAFLRVAKKIKLVFQTFTLLSAFLIDKTTMY